MIFSPKLTHMCYLLFYLGCTLREKAIWYVSNSPKALDPTLLKKLKVKNNLEAFLDGHNSKCGHSLPTWFHHKMVCWNVTFIPMPIANLYQNSQFCLTWCWWGHTCPCALYIVFFWNWTIHMHMEETSRCRNDFS